MSFLLAAIPISWFAVGAAIASILLFAGLRDVVRRRRRKAIEGVADELGLAAYANVQELEIAEGSDIAGILLAQKFLLHGQNALNQEFHNIMFASTDQLMIFVFDHQFDVYLQAGKVSPFPTRQSVVAIVSHVLEVPRFHFSIKSLAEDGFYEDFAIGLLDFLEANPGMTVEGKEKSIVVYEPGKRCQSTEYANLVKCGFQIYQIFNNEYSRQSLIKSEQRRTAIRS